MADAILGVWTLARGSFSMKRRFWSGVAVLVLTILVEFWVFFYR
jgi:hypothetical protein